MKPLRTSFLLVFLSSVLAAQYAGPAAASSPEVGAAWDELLGGAIPQAQADPVLMQPQAAGNNGSDFLNHIFFESRTYYERYNSSFRDGASTINSVLNTPSSGVFNPGGFAYPSIFQPSANRIDEFLDFGTRGWLSERINTHFAFRYRQDLTHVNDGAPAQSILNAFRGDRQVLFLDGTLEINSKPTDGFFHNSTIQLGRLNVYGAELAQLDGGLVTFKRRDFDLTLYGGRRFSFFSDPAQRAIGGANLLWKFDDNTSLELSSLLYIRASHRIVLRKRIHDRWLVFGGFRFYGGSPVDFRAEAFYSRPNGKDTLRVGFMQKMTEKDYTYDYTESARDLDPHNPLTRLYFGIIPPYSQLNVEEHHQFTSRIRASGAVVLRRLNDPAELGPYDTSFEDYKVSAQVFPFRKIETYFEYHQRNSDRLSPLQVNELTDLRASGETSIKDMSAEIRRTFGEGRMNLSGGMYYRRISAQDTFYYLNGLHQSGVLANAWVRVDRHTRAYFEYNLDNSFFLFTPDLKNSQIFRVGLTWKY